MRPRRHSFSLLLGLLLCLPSSIARANTTEQINSVTLAWEAEVSRLLKRKPRPEADRGPLFVEERIADAELLMHAGNHQHAGVLLTDVIQHFPEHAGYADALYLIAESLRLAGDQLTARTRYIEILERANEPRFAPYAQRSLARLIEIAVETQTFTGIEKYFAYLDQVPPAELENVTAYYRAKYLYERALQPNTLDALELKLSQSERQALDRALNAFKAVSEDGAYSTRARYFEGVIYALLESYNEAIEAFRSVLNSQQATEHPEVQHLAQLALARIYYQRSEFEDAIVAYRLVPNTSAHYDEALFELAWVYAALGDAALATETLRSLESTGAESHLLPDAKVLKGDLLLRHGHLDQADQAYTAVQQEFGPIREHLDGVQSAHPDLPGYFRDLVRQNAENFEIEDFLPAGAKHWVELGQEYERALGTMGELSTARAHLEDIEALRIELEQALDAPADAALFEDLRIEGQNIQELVFRALAIRRDVVLNEERNFQTNTPSLEEVRRERRALGAALFATESEEAPSTTQDERLAEQEAELALQLQAIEDEIQMLEQQLTTAEQSLTQAKSAGNDTTELANGIAEQKELIDSFRTQAQQFRAEMENVDPTTANQEPPNKSLQIKRYIELIAQERSLSGAEHSSLLTAIIARLESYEPKLEARRDELTRVAAERIVALKQLVQTEAQNAVGYRKQHGALREEIEDVAGAIAYWNFLTIRNRFYELVIRADSGHIDVAWAKRERRRRRIDILNRERARELSAIDEEFQDVAGNFSGEKP